MSLRAAALRYGDLLLKLIHRRALMRQWEDFNDLCDRFERLMANLPPAPQPLVWDGDYA